MTECEYEEYPYCPHCEHRISHDELSDLFFDDPDIVETNCSNCGTPITINIHVSYTYTVKDNES